MRRVAFAILCSCVFVSLGMLAGPARAGGGYGYDEVWYSASCCYSKVVRHERSVRYVPVGGYPGYPYHVRPYGWNGGAVVPHRVVQFTEEPVAYDPYAVPVETCYRRRAGISDWYGGWGWGVRATCY